MTSPFDCRASHGWSKPSVERVRTARTRHILWQEATRATLEAVVRYLVRRGWYRRRTSKARWDQRAESRYLQAPDRPGYEIRVSNHYFPASGRYRGAHEYIITRELMAKHTVLGIVAMIEDDLRKSNENKARRIANRVGAC